MYLVLTPAVYLVSTPRRRLPVELCLSGVVIRDGLQS